MIHHERYMQRCLELARKGIGYTAPNPMVGCVIVDMNQNILGEGYHEHYGAPHAEVNAINAVNDKNLLKNATLYVNLEPCAHYGKTPPCANLIVEMGIPRVVIGMKDPHEKVAGKGIDILQQAGIEVIVGIEENACREINKRFITFHEKHRPYIILKWAQSADGFIGKLGEKIKISHAETDVLVHRWRSEEQAILIGSRTAINDNPELTVRWVKGKNPIRIILHSTTPLPHDLRIWNNDSLTHVIQTSFNNSFDALLDFCKSNQIISVLVEGGAYTLQQFINAGFWDEARVITNTELILHAGVKAPTLTHAHLIQTISNAKDIIQIFHCKES
ncbi:MAG: bifunctional diaminohydroxyphosphoribosylaminopyrimidine deaminase/5-amino-6-(5-phosphoribosylamino)uracil reductase RibD [Flavobacteriales bacterium]|nr:bifunctional diaminohydroxyphosphoribosylaminopyrimidine deaminase/5-amino-6-(5-phosphoribosylamino)uracil reductase RibD [Flavobacteriales bacterium]